ncbi:MAG: hypothetical protein Q4G60_15380 [bacterium]|nr:hypothetical protein [bacterium]
MEEQRTDLKQEEQQRDHKKQTGLKRFVSWGLRIVNMGLVLLLLFILVPAIRSYGELRRENQYIAQKQMRIEKLRTDKEEYKQMRENRQALYDLYERNAEKAFLDQHGRTFETARSMISDICSDALDVLWGPLADTVSISTDISHRFEASYWVNYEFISTDQTDGRGIFHINLFRGDRQHEYGELVQTLIFKDIYLYDIYFYQDFNFDGYDDMTLCCNIYENNEQLDLDRHVIYLWDPDLNEYVYGGYIVATDIDTSDATQMLYCDQGTYYKHQYELWKFVDGELRYIGMEEENR